MAINWIKDGQLGSSHVGRVLEVFRRDYRAMSDVYTLATYARVATDAGTVEEVFVNANFECDMSGRTASVDATPEAIAVWDKVKQDVKDAEERRFQVLLAADREAERNRPVKGKKMVVAKGRKVPVGFQGTVSYVSGSSNVLLKKDDEWEDRQAPGVWVHASNLKAR